MLPDWNMDMEQNVYLICESIQIKKDTKCKQDQYKTCFKAEVNNNWCAKINQFSTIQVLKQSLQIAQDSNHSGIWASSF